MTGFALIGFAALTSLLVAASIRLQSAVSTLVVAYLAYVANLGIVTLALSPFREVTRTGLTIAELCLLGGAALAWRARGYAFVPLAPARRAFLEVIRDPLTVLFFAVVLVVLGYELLLASSPPNNMDSLTYHLARAAAWAQHGGIYWIPNAPEVEMNAYQPLAEQQDLFYLVATGGGSLYAAPQFLAELAVLVAVYGGSRRLGFAVRPAACASFLVGTFSLLVLESVTAQNDLVAASFPAVAMCLLLGRGRLEPALGGVAAAFALGTKLTTGLVVPILAVLALVRGRRVFGAGLLGGLAGFLVLGMWGYVLNAVHTGHLLGAGTAGVQDRASPAYPRSVANAFYLMYGLMDLSVLSNRQIYLLAGGGVLAAVCMALWTLRRDRMRAALAGAARVSLPFLAPLLVLGGAAVVAFGARAWGFPIRGPGGILGPLDSNLNEVYTRFANEDYSAYGPIGIVALLAAAVLTVRAFALRRVDARHLVLAAALPTFLVLVALNATWVPFLIRYFLLPAVLTAPLLARLFRGRATTAAYLALGALSIGVTVTHDQPKPLDNPYGHGRPWNLTQATALDTNSDQYIGDALLAYNQLVPPHACVGGVIDTNQPSYLLYGPHLEHHVDFLAAGDAVEPAVRDGLFYVVISTGADAPVADAFRAAGWRIEPLGTYWLLASDPHGAGTDGCGA